MPETTIDEPTVCEATGTCPNYSELFGCCGQVMPEQTPTEEKDNT